MGVGSYLNLRRLEEAEQRHRKGTVDGLPEALATMSSVEWDIERTEEFEPLPPPPGLPPRWYPLFRHPEQHRLWTSPARIKIIPAGRRSGKTERGKRKLVEKALGFTKFPDGRFIAAAPTYKQAKKIFWKHLLQLIPAEFRQGKPNISELTINLVNGATIEVVGLDAPERVEGSPVDGIIIDEFGDCKPDVWPINVRPALSTIGREGWAWVFGVPRGGRHYRALYDLACSGEDEDYEGFHWVSADILPQKEIEAARRSMTAVQFAAEYEASFETTVNRVYYSFDRARHVVPLAYNPKLPLIFCFDFNVEPGVAVVCQEQVYTGDRPDVSRHFTAVLDEVWVATNSTTPRVCAELARKWAPKHRGAVLCYGDPAGGSRHTTQVRGSDWDIIRDHLRPHFPQLRIKVDKKAPAIRSRTSAVNARLLTADDQVHALIDPSCQHLIIDFEDIVPDADGAPDKKVSPELSHESDAFGYYIQKAHPIHRRPARSVPII